MTTFEDFMNEIEAEAIAEGPQAVHELQCLVKFFRSERIRLENTMSNATYAFVFNGEDDWRLSVADDWELDVVELSGNEKTVGHKQIDGSICKILQTSDGQLVAITK